MVLAEEEKFLMKADEVEAVKVFLNSQKLESDRPFPIRRYVYPSWCSGAKKKKSFRERCKRFIIRDDVLLYVIFFVLVVCKIVDF